MKIYLASSFSLREKVERLSYNLENFGHTITVKWWLKDYKEVGSREDTVWYSDPIIKGISERNFKGIDEADALILVCHDEKTRKFNGANIEVGYAIAKGKKVYYFGKIERSAMYQPLDKW